MNIRAEFKNGSCKVYLRPVDKWEKELLGAIAKGGESLDAIVKYKPDGHFSYGNCEAVEVLLSACETTDKNL